SPMKDFSAALGLYFVLHLLYEGLSTVHTLDFILYSLMKTTFLPVIIIFYQLECSLNKFPHSEALMR
ncbi:hypothetical protein, partial [Peribacillus deserti]|uniref:hypothetical protein n=1 Tax=Peribacillus deserti TaxID=673318 RepID=UPI001C60CD48